MTRDSHVYGSIHDALHATGAFRTLRLGRSPEVSGSTTQASHPLAWIKPRRWKVHDTADPPCLIRVVTFEVEVATLARSDEPTVGEDHLQSLAQVVSETLTDTSHGGLCLPHLSTALEGEWPPRTNWPTIHAIVIGTFAYFLHPIEDD